MIIQPSTFTLKSHIVTPSILTFVKPRIRYDSSFSENSVPSANNGNYFDRTLLKCYQLLEVEPGCTLNVLKTAYAQRIKQLHPDTGGSLSDAEELNRVRDAFKYVVKEYHGQTDAAVSWADKVDDIALDKADEPRFEYRYTAFQHRQYLENEGFGYGSPSARARQFAQYRVDRGMDAAANYAYDKLVTAKGAEQGSSVTVKPRLGAHGEMLHSDEEAKYARRWRTTQTIERVVFDMVSDAMQRGDFDNLPGAGKPLRFQERNPYLDATTHKLNQIMVQNGFAPEWMTLQKEIREEMRRLRRELNVKMGENRDLWVVDSNLLDEKRQISEIIQSVKKTLHLKDFTEQVASLNKTVDHFNLIAPGMSRQLVQFSIDREIRRIIVDATVEAPLQDNSIDSTDTASTGFHCGGPKIGVVGETATRTEAGGMMRTLLRSLNLKNDD